MCTWTTFTTCTEPLSYHSSSYQRSKLNPSHPFQRVLALPRSVKLQLPFQKNLKSEFYPSNQEGHNLYQHFKRRETFEITHPYKFVNMLKFLCYKVQLIIQNIGNMINYNHSLTHVMHSLLSWTNNICFLHFFWWKVLVNLYLSIEVQLFIFPFIFKGIQE